MKADCYFLLQLLAFALLVGALTYAFFWWMP